MRNNDQGLSKSVFKTFIRLEILQPKLACPCGEGGVSIAPLPPQVVAQGQAGN